MNFNDITPKQFADAAFGPDDERMTACTHCGKVWYAVHYKDGFCAECQEKDYPAVYSTYARMKRIAGFARATLITIATTAIAVGIVYLLSFAGR
jgi:hypothetical protein